MDHLIKNFKAIFPGAFIAILAHHAEVTLGGGMGCITDTAGRYQQGAVTLHDIEHLLAEGNLGHDLGGILGLIGRVVVDGPLIELGATSEEKEREQEDGKKSLHFPMETRKANCVKPWTA